VNIFALQLESPGAIRMQGKSRAHRMMEWQKNLEWPPLLLWRKYRQAHHQIWNRVMWFMVTGRAGIKPTLSKFLLQTL
jgi:hypothetical protein